jgi:electron transport complex protein RnfB
MAVSTAAVVSIGDRCSGCGACLRTCPARAIQRRPRRLVVERGRCTGCLACVEICPAGAIDEGDEEGDWS